MKKWMWVILALMIFTFSAGAQGTEWQQLFFEDFDDNSYAWPLGNESSGMTSVDRVIRDSSYVWTVTTADPNISWMGLNTVYPQNAGRYRFSTEIRLPDFEPLACGGLLLDRSGNSFYGYVVCNDKTYSLIRYANGNVETLIPYSQIGDYDNFSSFEIAAEISNGWADLYFNGVSLDTYNMGFSEGGFGLIAMPESTETTEIAFGDLVFEASDSLPETTFDVAAVDPAASGDTARLVKMLNMKERISSSAGTYVTLPDREQSLAMMGYSSKESLGISGKSLLLQSDISWASGYERPDYAASGCGFYFRELNADSYIEVFAAMDGGVHVNAYRNGALIPLITLKYGNWNIEGGGRLAVAADEQKITILWNDSILGTVTDATWIGDGNAGYMIHSGTNGDFGTRCSFSDGEGYIFTDKE